MNDVVGLIVQPVAAIDAGIGGVGAYHQREGRQGSARVGGEQVAMAVRDVVLDDFRAGVAIGPLAGVALGNHLLTAFLDELHDVIKVGRR